MTPDEKRARIAKAQKVQTYLNDPDMKQFTLDMFDNIEKERKTLSLFTDLDRLMYLEIVQSVLHQIVKRWTQMAASGVVVIRDPDPNTMGAIERFNQRKRAQG